MKPLKYFAIIGAALFALSFTAQAHLEFQAPAVDFNNGPNGPPESNINVLIGIGIDTTGFVLCGNFEFEEGTETDQNIDVMPGSYLVVHYGKGPGGTGAGGSWEVFLVAGGETNVTVPGKGNVGGPDPFGHGGISSIREFCPPTTVPDSGTTAMLLGSVLAGLGLVRRYVKR